MLGGARPKNAFETAIFGVIFALGASLFLYNYSFFKFSADEPYSIILGEAVRDNNFLVGHSEASVTTGLVSPAFYSYVMGVVTWATSDPSQVMLIFTLFNIVGFLVATIYMARSLPTALAVLATLIMVTTPGIIFNANRIWSISILFPFVVLLHVAIYNFIKFQKPHVFALACSIATVTLLTHLSGVFLVPAIVILAFSYRKVIGFKWLGISFAIALFLSAPYIYFIFSGGGLGKIINVISAMGGMEGGGESIDLQKYYSRYIAQPSQKIIHMAFASSSVNYYEFIFGSKEYMAMVKWYAGPFAKPLYWLSVTVGVSFLFGWVSYIVWAIRSRKLVSFDAEEEDHYPVAFQISGFMFTSVIMVFLILRLNTWPHYYQILHPSFAILSAWPAYRLWRVAPVRILFSICLASHILLTLILCSGIKESGYAKGYKTTFEMQKKIGEEVWNVTPDGKVPQLYTYMRISTLAAVYSMVGWENAIGNAKREPVVVILGWDDYRKKTIWSVRNIRDEIDQRLRLIEHAVSLIPEGATALAHDSYSAQVARDSLGNSILMPVTGSDKIKSWIKSTALGAESSDMATPYTLLNNRPHTRRYVGGDFPTNAGGAEYVILNLHDPRKLNPVRNLGDKNALRDMLRNPGYGLLFHEEGVFVFKKKFPKTLDADFYADFIFDYPVEETPKLTGVDALVSVDPRRTARIADEKNDDPDFMTFGPYITLPEGEYETLFDIRIETKNGEAPLQIDVTAQKGKVILAQKDISDDSGGQWQTVSLPFSVGKSGFADIEFRARFTGKGSATLSRIRLKATASATEEYMNNLKR